VPREAVAETERWFLKRGLPHFIDGYSVTRDVLTRAVPVLVFVLLLELLNAPKSSYPIWLDVLALAGGLAILVGAWMLSNGLRHRPLFARPSRVGIPEVAFFVLAPAVIPLVFGGQWRSAVGTAALNLGILGAVYLVTSYGIVPMTRWAGGETIHELNAVFGLLGRAMPLLVLFITFTFLQNEVWQISAELYGPFYWIVFGLFPLTGLIFAVIRLPKEVGQLSRFESWQTVQERVAGTPAERLVGEVSGAPEAPPLSTRQWINLGLVVLFSQGLQVVIVTATVFVFLLGFGFLVVTGPLVESFVGVSPHVLATLDLWGRQMVLTEELLRVAGFLAVFSGFYFAVSVLTDQTYREEFLAEVVDDLRQALAVRAVYLGARRSAPTTLLQT
jgi:hypothetical protein